MVKRDPIVILSYFFPPCNLTPSERIYSWAKYLKKGNYYPIIITRNWDTPIKNSTTDVFKNSGTEILIKKYEDYEVHYLPYKGSLKDRLFIQFDGTKFYLIYLIFTFIYNFLQFQFLKLNPTYSFINYAVDIIQKSNCTRMVVSAGPFELFGYAYKIWQKTKIRWIADYRDDWTTTELYKGNLFKHLVNKYNSYFEKKWLSSCDSFLSVSDHYVSKISNLIKKKGLIMTNGYLPENYQFNFPLFDEFTITYVGSIYSTQPIELFLEAIKELLIENNHRLNLKVIFIGIKDEPAIIKRILNNIAGYESYFEFTSRIPKNKAIEIQSRSHMLLVCAHKSLKGIPGSKLYEYVALKKPVLLFPSDQDIVERTLLETGQGLLCSNSNDLIKHISLFLKNEKNIISINNAKTEFYSRIKLVDILIQALDDAR